MEHMVGFVLVFMIIKLHYGLLVLTLYTKYSQDYWHKNVGVSKSKEHIYSNNTHLLDPEKKTNLKITAHSRAGKTQNTHL